MKDIEKIKSEDLGCQVQDANPGNFAIEQEVGAMVGATVPAPTAPSADDARELGAQLLVFLRRALTPIKSALRTALAAIYAHLDSRCTDYTPAGYATYQPLPSYDPMGTPPTPRTLPNLLTAITAFASRKISNGSATNDGIKDGISLARLLMSGTDASAVTTITDDTPGWTCNRAYTTLTNLFPNASGVLTLRCKSITGNFIYNPSSMPFSKLYLPDTESIDGNIYIASKNFEIDAPKVVSLMWKGLGTGPDARVMNFPSCRTMHTQQLERWWEKNTPILAEKIVLGSVETWCLFNWYDPANGGKADDLMHFELGADGLGGAKCSMNMNWWTAANCIDTEEHRTTFLQNFLEHICQRLANRTGQTKLTLTLSAAVYTAIMTDNDIKAELVARNWKVTDGTNNYNN